jgi:hypothetical protein
MGHGGFEWWNQKKDFSKLEICPVAAHRVRHRSECPAQLPWVSTFVNIDLGWRG